MEGLTARSLLPLLMGTEEPSSLLWLEEKEGPAAAPEEAHRGPSIPWSAGSCAGPRGHGGGNSLSAGHCGSWAAEQTRGLSVDHGI